MDKTKLDAVRRMLVAAGFDAKSYRWASADLVAGLASDEESFWHFSNHGCYEGRRFPIKVDVPGLLRLHKFATEEGRPEITYAILATMVRNWADAEQANTLFRAASIVVPHLTIKPVMVIGDSHTEVYRVESRRNNELIIPFRVPCIAGSAKGLNNPSSKSGYGKLISITLKEISKDKRLSKIPIILKFGQVDTEFVFNFKRVKSATIKFNPQDFNSFCQRSVDAYGGFLSNAIPRNIRRNVDVFSIFPPVLSDEALREGYYDADISRLESQEADEKMAAELSELEHPDLATRVNMHATYNAMLRRKCESLGVSFVDDFSGVLDSSGLPERRFWERHNGRDHHLMRNKGESYFARVLADRASVDRRSALARILDRLRGPEGGQLAY